MATYPSDEGEARTEALVRELEAQTDRGVAIVGVAWVEEALTAALESFLVKDKAAWARLFRKSGPLSSLASKIDLSRLLDMTSKAVASDLHILREVRNEFAHAILDKNNAAISFTTPRVKDRCLALRTVAHEKHRAPKSAFIRACAVLNADFEFIRFMGQTVAHGGQVRANGE